MSFVAGDSVTAIAESGHITIHPWAASSTVGTWGIGTAGGHIKANWSNTSAAQNDETNYKVYLTEGSYTLDLRVGTNNNRGIITVQLDGVSKGTIDTYSAGASTDVQKTLAFTVSTGSLKTMKFLVATKNESSSGFLVEVLTISLYQTSESV